jgi:RNA processing factor Prp31
MLKKTREQIEEKFAGKEIHIIKAVNLLSDLDSINNLMSENLNEWKIRNPQNEAQNQLETLQRNTIQIQEEKTKLIEFIEKEMQEEFPNFSQIATPIIGAKLLSEAGSKKRLCFMPASTIQVLGAEKALFAHLRKNAKSPKHGHLFNHPLLQNMPRFKRGKAARIIAGKLAIALKQDYFKGEDTSKKVKEELEKKIIEIRNEPETEAQKQKEKNYEQINKDRRKEEFVKENKKREHQMESRTFTPEERRAYFANQKRNKDSFTPRENYSNKSKNFGKSKNRTSDSKNDFNQNYNKIGNDKRNRSESKKFKSRGFRKKSKTSFRKRKPRTTKRY